MADNQYEYTPLSSATIQIRLLKIQSISDATIGCSLGVYNLSAIKGHYYTLSYVWGNQGFTETILCDGKALSLTPSLEKTMRELFKYQVSRWDLSGMSNLSVGGDSEEQGTSVGTVDEGGREEESNVEDEEILGFEAEIEHLDIQPHECLFWIDAICLNQKDPVEIALQIPLMGEIYSCSHMTFAYLGPAADESDLVLSEMAQLNRNLARLIRNQDISDNNLGIRRGLGLLVERPYFSRVWILQEAVIAKQLIVGCGDQWIPGLVVFHTFNSLFRIALAGRLFSQPHVQTFDYVTLPVQLLKLMKFREQKADNVQQVLSLMQTSRKRGCKEPADHIWGVFGLLDPAIQDSLMSCFSQVNLSLNATKWKDIYIKFAKWCIQNDDSLQFLLYAPSQHRPVDLPSWCPNWDSKMPYNPVDESYATGRSGDRGSGDPMEKRMRVLPAGSNNLELPGFRVDVVSKIIASTAPSTWQSAFLKGDAVNAVKDLLQWEKEALVLSRTAYNAPPGSVPQQHWRSLVANYISEMEGRQCPEENDYLAWLGMLESFQDPESEDPAFNRNKFVQYSGAFSRASERRHFMSTRGGRVGWVPSGAEEGDVICVFYGGDPLFVIRFEEDGTKAKLVGEAYVQGLMGKDEAFQSTDRGDDETIILI